MRPADRSVEHVIKPPDLLDYYTVNLLDSMHHFACRDSSDSATHL